MYGRLKKVQNIVIIDKLTSELAIHNKSSRFNGRASNALLTDHSQVHPKGVTKAHVRGAKSHIDKHSISHCGLC